MRDEEAVLDDCLASLDGLVDEIVIVDTGSEDRSLDIAARHGARILHRPWDDDFAAPRNFGLDHAAGEWILYVDADERLTVSNRAHLAELLADAPEVAFRILLRPEVRMTPYLEYRLWRNDPRIRFVGAIHERVVSSIHAVAAAEGRPITDCVDVLLEHVGYEGDQLRKHLRNLPLLERFVQDNPDHVFARHHLATVLDGLGRHGEAESILEGTVTYMRETESFERDGVLVYASLIGMRRGRGKDFHPLLTEALRLYPDNAVLLFMEGEHLSTRGEHAAALARFDAILQVAAERPAVGKPAYDRALIGERTHAARGLCLFKLGHYTGAADAYAAALREAPGDLGYRVKYRLAVSRVEAGSTGRRHDGAPTGRRLPHRPRGAGGHDDGAPHAGTARETGEEPT
jgi:glycosyltransferase involved in cell wall biosynthesis